MLTSKQHNYIAGVHPLTSSERRVSAALTVEVNRVTTESNSDSNQTKAGVTNAFILFGWIS